AARADLVDRRPAARARLSSAVVHAEALLSAPAAAVGPRVVAQACALAADAGAQRFANGAREPRELIGAQCACLAQRVELRAPERLVDVDVPEPRDDALVEQCGLQRRAPVREPLAEPLGRERPFQRLTAEAPPEIVVHLLGLEQVPRAEAADIAIGDGRAIV